jgi:branched-chain amino acid transport system permease protein
VIIGGLGNVWGAAIAGVALGLIESFGAVFISSAYQTMFGFLVLLMVIALRPAGLFASGTRRIA